MENIKSRRLLLRPIEFNDANAVFHYRSNAVENKYQGWIPKSIDDVHDFIKNKTNPIIDVADTWFQFVIITSQNRLIGDIGLHFIGDDGMQVEVGCTLDKDFHGKGYATEALTEVINYLVLVLKKHRIITSIDPRNTTSIKLMEKLGFRKEAHFKESLFLHGEWVDDVVYAILANEWLEKQNKKNH